MKKYLALVVVLSLVAMANASLSVVWDEPTNVLSIVSNDTVYSSQSYFLLIAGPSAAADAGTMLYTGNLAAITDMSSDADLGALAAALVGDGVTRIDLDEFTSSTQVLATGTVTTYNITGAAPGNWAYLTNADLDTVISQVELTPEPMTLVLLGLGGLFIRRK